MTSPALNASGDYAVVYDVGGKELKVVKGDILLHELTLPDEELILCATVNEKGWVAVASKASGYKGVVTVYNRDFESVLTIRLSSRYISDAVVTPDSRGVYLISPGQADGAFENTLLYYTISSPRGTDPDHLAWLQRGPVHPQRGAVLDHRGREPDDPGFQRRHHRQL